jgi:hypothetical protein
VALAVDYLIGNVHQPQPVSGGPAKVPSLDIESVEHEQTHSKRTLFHLELFASQRKCQFYLNTINQDGNQQQRGKRETRNPFTLTCYSFAPLCELPQATMPPLAVPPDVICSLIVNLLNLLVNALLLWQSQKLFIVMVCFVGSEDSKASHPRTAYSDTEATRAMPRLRRHISQS